MSEQIVGFEITVRIGSHILYNSKKEQQNKLHEIEDKIVNLIESDEDSVFLSGKGSYIKGKVADNGELITIERGNENEKFNYCITRWLMRGEGLYTKYLKTKIS